MPATTNETISFIGLNCSIADSPVRKIISSWQTTFSYKMGDYSSKVTCIYKSVLCMHNFFFLPKQSQRFRSILQAGSKSLKFFLKCKAPVPITKEDCEFVVEQINGICHWSLMHTEKLQPEGKLIMLEMRFTQLPALSVYLRVWISWSVSETGV